MYKMNNKELHSIDYLLLSIEFFLCAAGQVTATLILALVYLVLYKNKNGIKKFIGVVLLTLFPVLCTHFYTLYTAWKYAVPATAITKISESGIGAITLVDRGIVVTRIVISILSLILGVIFLFKSRKMSGLENDNH